MLWLETKWASLVSYGVTVDLLKDVLPIGARLNAETVRRHLARVANRMEAELADERYSFVETSAYEREQLPNPEGPITVGIDGVCSGWGLNPTLRVLPVPFDYLANGVFADG